MGSDDDQRRLLRRVRHAWLVPAGTMLLDVFSPVFWAACAGQGERVETVSRLVSGEVRTVRLDVPIVAKYGFDPIACRFLSEWWPEGQKEKAITESVRCYAAREFVELVQRTGLAADRFEVEGWRFDPEKPGDAAPLLRNKRSYRVRLIREG